MAARPAPRPLARTDSDRVSPDPRQEVLDHHRVLEYAASKPNAGRTRVGNASVPADPRPSRSVTPMGPSPPISGSRSASTNLYSPGESTGTRHGIRSGFERPRRRRGR
ncbi:hypothetical protein CK500_09340 [Halorubrum salipaludis]|uniref:Uncharacterized protein n=1 Tax=Halorubrum salipaludis TaxID=2032630 RepID=A0A2A2FG17_9EURY|nr:hypothetical protein CK500_09340 [Halorubrum salipaludis]